MNTFVKTGVIATMLLSMALPALAATTKVDGACMASAVDKRDTSISSAIDKLSTSLKSAVDARKNALKTAWGNTDATARHKAILAAWQAYMKASKDARATWLKEKHAAWQQFYTDRKACGKGAAAEDSTTEAVDSMI